MYFENMSFINKIYFWIHLTLGVKILYCVSYCKDRSNSVFFDSSYLNPNIYWKQPGKILKYYQFIINMHAIFFIYKPPEIICMAFKIWNMVFLVRRDFNWNDYSLIVSKFW